MIRLSYISQAYITSNLETASVRNMWSSPNATNANLAILICRLQIQMDVNVSD